MSTVHAASIDYSPDTGSLVVCTCGLTLGPFNEYKEARSAAVEHRRFTGAEVIGSEERRRERNRRQTAKRAAARRAAREQAAEAEGRP